ncbi:protein phosphatase 2C-like domain-containing protein 1 [Ahaetulla prasina]|uniref:protein phosphatase 2C-like domain-containing protein 1 n=1 Tax=Ahaetulla prasina TaxID=499056 RepID=UPI0026496CED|nr:protein phosphatase 2C-like domain-containing protein 1 [Ahaetulla prasina]XP_058039759.1 protein phosphatase 2C-like domain-containing protein 1 [Ahaetulla prasina]
MTYQTELQNSETSEEEQKLQNSESCKEEQDLAKVLNFDFKQIESLNIRIPCSICEEMVYISQLFHHKKVHQAQAVLDYQWPFVEPIDIKKNIIRRKQLILRLQKTAQYPEREIEKIGCSIDLLKESIKIAPYFCIDNIVQSSAYIKEVSNPLIKAIAICQDKNAVWHTEMEDVYIVLDNYGHKKDTCLLGLFDGSNGISAAQLTSDELPLLLLDQLSHNDSSYQISDAEKNMLHSFCTIFKEDYEVKEQLFAVAKARSQNSQSNKYEWIHKAFAKAFWRMDRLLRLGRGEISKVCWSSCTTAICLVEMASNIKQNQEQEGEETTETINDNEEQKLLQHKKGLPKTNRIMIRSITEQEVDKIMEQQEEKPLGRVSDGEEQNNTEQEEDSETELHKEDPLSRICHGKGQNNTEQEACSLTGNPGELFTSINDEMKKSIIESEDNEQSANCKDEIQEEGWIENNENSDEIDGIMHIANIGNVHAVLCKNGKSYWLTKEHSTYCREERRRILQNGGSISSNEPKGLIEGLIKNTRGLGHHGNPKLKKTVIPVPNTISFSVDNSCQFLIIATNGLWEVLDKSEVVLLTITLYSAYLAKYQHAQLMKRYIPKASKLSLEDRFYSWYMNRDFFPESDLGNEEETVPSFPLKLPINNSTEEKVLVQSKSCTISTKQLSENSLETPVNVPTSSKENTKVTQKESNKNSEDLISESHEFLQISEDSETDSRTFYNLAAKYITKHLVKAALKAGSRNNVSVLLAVLNGCDNVPTDVLMRKTEQETLA